MLGKEISVTLFLGLTMAAALSTIGFVRADLGVAQSHYCLTAATAVLFINILSFT